MSNTNFPKITFGIIVLNGEPFTRYCLKSIYPYAYEIIVVEGGHKDARLVCTPDGHSVDGTLETLHKFKKEEDPENKLTIVTRDGFWPKQDELGRDRTPQSRAYAERAKGDYLWQIDIDEFYRHEDMLKILKILSDKPDITAVTFPTYTFWGDIGFIADSCALRRGAMYYHRLFKWGEKYHYLTHEPPTVIDENSVDLRTKKWISGKTMEKKKIFMYHYSLLFPWQVEQKVKVYKTEKPDSYAALDEWANNNFFKLGDPFRVHNLFWFPSWLERFKGSHPEQIICMMNDINEGKINMKLRQTDDIELIVDSLLYKLRIILVQIEDPLNRLFIQLKRIKNIPNRIRKIKAKYFSK
jgi:hypothetical protein